MSYNAIFNASQTQDSSLTLSGSNGYSIHGDRVILTVPEIANHRNFDNLSGSLSLEFWALDRPYAGGDFDGVALAGTEIGRVQGQHLLVNGQYDLPFTAPRAGTWILTLMLREWEGNGFVTRDHVQFAQPYVVERPALAAVQAQVDNVIRVDFGAAAESRSEPVARTAPQTDAQQPVKGEPVAKVEPKIEPKASVKAAKTAAVKAATNAPEKAAAPVDGRISINTASHAEIAGIKGVSKKLAESIVAARPFDSVDALLAVKGVGPKLLSTLRPLIRL